VIPLQDAPSATAVLAAAARAAHLLVDEPPHLVVDHDAARICSLFTPAPLDFHRQFPDEPVLAAARGSAVLRASFARELLSAGGVSQVVLLGAGLDTFLAAAFPGPVWLVDRPEMLDWRRQVCQRAGVEDVGTPVALALPDPELLSSLVGAGLNPDLPTAVVALGLSMYLTEDQNRSLISSLALPAGSLLLMDVLVPNAEADAAGRAYVAAVSAQIGNREPWLSRFTPVELEQVLAAAGWKLRESRPEAEQGSAQFWRTQPHLHPMRLVELVVGVPGA
jgi:methyltransferase (TIGR00027 family)